MKVRLGRRTTLATVFIITLGALSWWELSYGNSLNKRADEWKLEESPTMPEDRSPQSVIILNTTPEENVKKEPSPEPLRSAAFRLMELPHALQQAAFLCSEGRVDCRTYDDLMTHMRLHAETEGDAKLYVIPIDPLAWLHESRSSIYMELMQDLVDVLNTGRPYMTFKGSDHVFLCLTDSCQSFAEEFAVMLSGNLGTRAIFAGVDVDIHHLRWPCPFRVISVDKSNLKTMHDVVQDIILQATFMIVEGNRWVCSDKMHPHNYFGEHNETMGSGGIFMEEYGFMMCHIPKSGSTMMNFLLRRMIHAENWRTKANGLPHNPRINGLHYVDNKKDFNLMKRIYDDPAIVTAAVVRHPVPRMLSSYLDKIEILKEYQRIHHLPEYVEEHGVPSFGEFVEFLIETSPDANKIDEHFRMQSSMCGLRDHRFDFVGHLSDLGTEFKEFSKSLGFWEAHVESGWGEDHNQTFGVKSYQNDQRYAHSALWHHYTEELMVKVYNYYKEDFDRFDFSIDDMLATNPAAQKFQDPIQT